MRGLLKTRWLVVIFLLLTLLLASVQVVNAGTPGTMSEITISNLVITPTEASTGQTVTISMTVKESANVSGIYEGTLTINGVVAEKKKKTIGPLAVTDLTFTVTKNQPGTYEVDLDGLKGSFTVTAATLEPDKKEDTPPSKFPTMPVVGGVVAVLVVGGVFVYLFKNKRATK